MDPSRFYHQLNLIPSPNNYIDPRLLLPKSSPFRFSFGGSPANKTTDDERLALLDRFRSEGLDVRKLNDAQKLPFVWRWLVDAEINCQSLRHQIEKMRIQHDEELQEVEDYIEQVWKLSTERLILLEDENKCLREKCIAASTKTLRRFSSSKDNNNDERRDLQDDGDDEEGDDSDVELERCLYGTGKGYSTNRNNRRPSLLVQPLSNGTNGNTTKLMSGTGNGTYRNNLVNSSSTSSLASSVSNGQTMNLCDSLKMRSSRSCWQLAPNGNGPLNNSTKILSDEKTRSDNRNTSTTNYCEKCELLDAELMEMRQKCLDLEGALDDSNEKNFVLEKLNRSIEMENENFAYKLAEAEDRSNQLERRILLLEKECRHLKSSPPSSLLDTSSVATSGLGSSNGSSGGGSSRLMAHSPNDQSTRRLIDEMNHKVKSLEEALDHRCQLYEELEMKYEKQKVKQHETLWKLRKFIQDKELHTPTNLSDSEGNGTLSTLAIDDLLLMASAVDDSKTMTTSNSTDSGLLTLDPIGPSIHNLHNHHHEQYAPTPRHRTQSVHKYV